MNLEDDKTYKMKMRDVEAAFKYRRIPYPKRSVEIIAIIAISCTFLLFLHTNKLNSRLKDMEIKLQPSELSGLGLIETGRGSDKAHDPNSLQGTYKRLKETGQQRRHPRSSQAEITDDDEDDNEIEPKPRHQHRHEHKGHHHRGATAKPHALGRHKALKDEDDVVDDDDDDNEDYNDEDDEPTENFVFDRLKALKLNNTRKAEVDVVFFNRVPKVGSQSLMQLMARLGKINGYETSRDVGKAHETILLRPPEQKSLLIDILSKPQPHVYSQHIAYINFTRHHLPKPIYINMVRDPVERIVSWHYYVRARWYYEDMKKKLGDKAPEMPPDEFLDMDMDECVRTGDIHCIFEQGQIKNPAGDHRRQTLFFCGQNTKVCMPFNSKAAMQKAKRTVERDYAVVGSWEDTNITLTVLEHYIPKFFKNAKVAYYLGKDHLSKINKNTVKRGISDESRAIIRKNLTNEIEFYEFCKQRLYLQYTAITGGKKIDQDDYLLLPEHAEDEDLEY